MPHNHKSNIKVVPKKKRYWNKNRRQPKSLGEKLVNDKNKQKAVQVGETVKQLESDIRFSDKRVNATVANQLSNQLKEVVFEQVVSATTISGIILSYISYALEKGYEANATAENYPYFAYCYITQMVLNAIQNGVPLTTDAPYWLVCLIQAVSSKTVPFANGRASYRFKLDNPTYVPPPSAVMSVSGSRWWVYSPSATNLVDGFPVGDDPSQNPLYTQILGQQAWTSITEFMSSSSTLLGSKKENKMVKISTKTPFSRDVSSFGVNSAQLGGGFNGIGGPGTNIQLEVPILHPQFSVFNSNGIVTPPEFRYPNYVSASAGDPTFLGGFLCNLASVPNYNMKRAPKFHFVDFGEFVDVVCYWLAGMLQAYINSPTFLTAFETDSGGFDPANYQCPLTFQEFQIILRNVLMGVFKDTQASVQGLAAHNLQTTIDQQFVAFTCGSNSCFISHAGGMTLPLPLIENLRALTFRYLARKGSLDKNNLGDLEMLIPVLGAFNGIALDASAYTATVVFPDGQTNTFPVFSAESHMVRRTQLKTSKGATFKEEAVAIPIIDLIDGTALLNNQSTPIFINDPDRLSSLNLLYNDWLKQNMLTYSCGTGQYSADAGPSSLCCINMTRYVFGLNNDTKTLVKDRHARPPVDKDVEVVDTRLEKKFGTRALASPYINIGYATTSATNPIMDAPYSGVLDLFILPVVNAQTVTGDVNYDTAFQRWQSAMREAYSTTDTTGTSITTYATRHAMYAAKMYSSIMNKEDDWMIVITHFLTTGEGGILSSTIAGMIPGTAGAILQGIASLLPI